jgi:hypothetical protein
MLRRAEDIQQFFCKQSEDISRRQGEAVLTYYIVPIIILDQSKRIAFFRAWAIWFLDHLQHDFPPLVVRSEHQALLNDIAGKLVLREVEQVCLDQTDDFRTIFRSAMFDDVLSDVVAVLIGDEVGTASVEFL